MRKAKHSRRHAPAGLADVIATVQKIREEIAALAIELKEARAATTSLDSSWLPQWPLDVGSSPK